MMWLKIFIVFFCYGLIGGNTLGHVLPDPYFSILGFILVGITFCLELQKKIREKKEMEEKEEQRQREVKNQEEQRQREVKRQKELQSLQNVLLAGGNVNPLINSSDYKTELLGVVLNESKNNRTVFKNIVGKIYIQDTYIEGKHAQFFGEIHKEKFEIIDDLYGYLCRFAECNFNNTILFKSENIEWEYNKLFATTLQDFFQNRNYSVVLQRNYGMEANSVKEFQERNIAMFNQKFDQQISNFQSAYAFFRQQFEKGQRKFDFSFLLDAVWYYAFHKPNDMERYNAAVEILNKYFAINSTDKYNKSTIIECMDVLLSEIYMAKEFGEGVLNDKKKKLNEWLEYYINKKEMGPCVELASGLKWMGLYKLEGEVLRKIAAAGLPLSNELQERIRFIENVGNDYKKVHHIDSSDNNILQLDYTTLNWKEDDYIKLFKTLAYENITLQYSLTIREWAKNLIMESASGVATDVLFRNVIRVIKEEYLSSVKCVQKEFSLLSSNGIETAKKGLLVVPEKTQVGFDHVALLLNVIAFGKNINLRIYTLSMPNKQEIEKQKQQILSLKTNTNPDVVVFEEGIRATILKAIEEYMNGSQKTTADIPVYEVANNNEQQLF